jgi:Fur family ferric uptake transcriptional regulator
MTDIEQVERDLRAAGLRRTAPRVAVLAALRDEPGHRRVDEVVEAVRGRLGRVSTQAVYDVLGALEAAGLARRVQPAGGAARFEARTTDHHHAVCRECGAITDIDGPRRPLARADLAGVSAGFVADHVELTLWGRCAACVVAGATPRELPTTATTRSINHE